MNHETTIQKIQSLVPDVMKLEKGVEVFVNSNFGIQGYGNVQCVRTYTQELGSISLYGHNENGKDYNVIKILGKPITLAVVLEAIREANVGFVFVTHSGTLHKKVGIEDTAHTYLGIWNLSKDNFNDQSDETKAFIGGLLN